MKIFVLGSVLQACCWKMDRLPKPGETCTASELSIETGGKGLNVAIGARRLGANVDVMLGIGQDAVGNEVLQLLEREGLNADYTWRLSPRSGYGAGLIAADGQNTIAVYPGPNLLLDDTHVAKAESAIEGADLVYGQLEISLSALASAFRLARENGAITVLNPSPWRDLPQSVLNDTEVLLVNEIEATNLLSLPSPPKGSLQDYAEFLQTRLDSFWLKWPGSLLVVTLGEAGSLAFERNGSIAFSPAFQTETVNSVGAGDAFASSICLDLCKRTPLNKMLRHGNACGAIMASNFSVVDAFPDKNKLASFLKSRD